MSSFSLFSLLSDVHHLYLPSFPTRRSSDLVLHDFHQVVTGNIVALGNFIDGGACLTFNGQVEQNAQRIIAIASQLDRKSTRLNSSHVAISYAVFCLKKKIEEICYNLIIPIV